MNSDKGITRRLFLNASWLFGGKTAASIFSALQTIIIARMLGVKDYGLLVLIVAYVDILNQFFDLRVWETATKYIGTFWAKGERDKTLSMIKLSYIIDISSGILAFGLAVATAKIASQYILNSPQSYHFIWIYAFSLLIDTANSTSYAILRVFNRFKNIAFIDSLTGFLRLAMVSAVLYMGLGIDWILFSFVLSTFLAFGIRLAAVSKTLKVNRLDRWWTGDLSLIRDQWKGIAWFLGNTSLAATLKMAGDAHLGVLAVGYFAGKEGAAYYKIAKSSAKVMTRIADPLYEAIYPELVMMITNNALSDLRRLLKQSTKDLMKFILPVATVILVFADQIVSLIYGRDYLPASNALRIVTLAIIISRLVFWAGPAILALGKPGLRTTLGVISTGIYVISLFLLVPQYSYMGAAYSFLVYCVIRSTIMILALKSSLSERERTVDVSASPPASPKPEGSEHIAK